MFNGKYKSYDEFEKKIMERADILFPTMTNKNKVKKLKNLPLGKSIYDEDYEVDLPNIKSTGKIKSELEILTDDKTKNQTKLSEHKSRKDRTPEEDEEILDLMYPSMRHLGKDKINQTDDEKSEKDSKKGSLTGGAADVKQSQNNTMKVTEPADKTINHIKNKKQVNKTNFAKSEKSEDKRNRDALKILGMDDTKYQIAGNTISPKTIPPKYEIINEIKYPAGNSNPKIEKLKQQSKEDIKRQRDEFLKHNAKLEQFGLDYVDNPLVKFGDKLKTRTDEAVENLHMSKANSFLNTDYAKKHKVMNSYKEEPEYLHKYYQKKIQSQGGDAEKMPGILIDEKSNSSQKLKNSLLQDSVFMEKLKKYSNAMHKGYAINDSMDFEDKNWHNAIGKSDIVNMHFNKKGDIEFDIVDVYDFNEGEKNKLVKIGRDRQEKGEIKPYFQRYHVIIPQNSKIGNTGKK